ncbi:30S ribosomal protein S3 [Candidatus Pacearchaeota archaeon]|nr:30S ribosomal protein S3 [Candidatus Pacearchaeota archaeon]
MIERKFIQLKKDEFAIKEFVKEKLGKGRISGVKIEYTPVGEKIIVYTTKPGLIIGRRGERINELSEVLKKKFKLENPHIEIAEITKPEFNAGAIADEIALALERFGPLKFKIIAYKTLQKIKDAGALGAEIRLGGKLPSERARSWRFAFGYLKKTGDTAKVVDKAESVAQTIPGIIGIKVAIMPPDAEIHDRVEIDSKIIKEMVEIKEKIDKKIGKGKREEKIGEEK